MKKAKMHIIQMEAADVLTTSATAGSTCGLTANHLRVTMAAHTDAYQMPGENFSRQGDVLSFDEYRYIGGSWTKAASVNYGVENSNLSHDLLWSSNIGDWFVGNGFDLQVCNENHSHITQ